MNYESLGRYTEACDKAQGAKKDLLNELAALSRRVSMNFDSGNAYAANEIDFPEMHKELSAAESHYGRMMESLQCANHEAPLCGKPLLKIYKRT